MEQERSSKCSPAGQWRLKTQSENGEEKQNKNKNESKIRTHESEAAKN